MSNHFNSTDDAHLDQILAQAKLAQGESPQSDTLLKARIMAALPTATMPTTASPTNWLDAWLDSTWQWFTQPVRLAAAAALPLLVGFALGNATLITDSELLLALSEQESWPVEQMLEDNQWSSADE